MEITNTIAEAREQEIKQKWNRTWLIANSLGGGEQTFEEFWQGMQKESETTETVSREEAEQEALRIEEKFKEGGTKKTSPIPGI